MLKLTARDVHPLVCVHEAFFCADQFVGCGTCYIWLRGPDWEAIVTHVMIQQAPARLCFAWTLALSNQAQKFV